LVNLFNILKDHNINESLLCPYGDGNASEKILKILESENV